MLDHDRNHRQRAFRRYKLQHCDLRREWVDMISRTQNPDMDGNSSVPGNRKADQIVPAAKPLGNISVDKQDMCQSFSQQTEEFCTRNLPQKYVIRPPQ